MKRTILVAVFGVLTASLASAQQQPPLITRVNLQTGKSVEGGIAVNPVTHKAYVLAELATEGADDYKAVFVIGDNVLIDAKTAPKRLNVTPGTITSVLKYVHVPYENEYIAVDSARNLIYVPTKFTVEQDESDSSSDSSDAEPPGGTETPALVPPKSATPAQVILGTLTVIDGNTDTVIATWYFPEGVEPEGVAVDPATGVVYVGAKAPEGEGASDDVCNSWATPIPDVGEPADVECWTSGHIFAFFVETSPAPMFRYLKSIPAGDDPESVVFQNGMVYAANEDDGTVTIATAVKPDGSGGVLVTDLPKPPTQPYSAGVAPYSLGVFYTFGPNPKACIENKFEADKMAAGGGSVFITDDRSGVAKITGATVVDMVDIPGATVCENIPNTDGGGLNTANNIGFMSRGAGDVGLLYVLSEQNTVAIVDPDTMQVKTTITVPGAVHLDGIAVDPIGGRVWLTDEELQAVFVLQGACATGTGACIP